MTSRQALVIREGFTHASNVIAVVSRRAGESRMVTRELVPLNTRAWPNLPAVVHVALAIVPVPPFPDASETVVPVPSSNEYAATSPDCARAVAGAQNRAIEAIKVCSTTHPIGRVMHQHADIRRTPMRATGRHGLSERRTYGRGTERGAP